MSKAIKKLIIPIIIFFSFVFIVINVFGDSIIKMGRNIHIYRESTAFVYFQVISIFVGILFIITLILTRRPKIYHNYIKSTKVVLDPIFAESIIDGKIGAKELIMSCIVDLINRSNLKTISNSDYIQINNLKNTTIYERKIIELIFENKNKISIEEIGKIFSQSNKATRVFYKKLNFIKAVIEEYFFREEIYSRKAETMLKLIECLSFLIFGNIIGFSLFLSGIINLDNILVIIGIANFWGLILYAIRNRIKNDIIMRKDKKEDFESFKLKLFGYFAIIVYIAIISINIFNNFLIFLGLFIVLILNVIILKKSKKHCLTNKGIVEYNKAYALKRYMQDYSILKDRDIDGVIVWDRYLAYACAFGISKRITDKFDEEMMELNILLQKLDSF